MVRPCWLPDPKANKGQQHTTDEMTLGEDTKDPTTHWGSERIGCED